MPHADSEAALENATLALFRELGWQTVNAYDETFGAGGTLGREHRGEVVLLARLRPALQKLNPGLPSEALQLALDELIREGWFLGADAAELRDEAERASVPGD